VGQTDRTHSRPDPADDRADEASEDRSRGRSDQPSDEAIEHLQAAAGEMIAAARSFIDAVEGVVHDREAVASVVDTFSSVAQAAAQAASNMNPARRRAPEAGSDGAGGRGGPDDPDDPPGVQHIRVS